MTLQNATAIPTIAVTDLDEGKRFYTDKLGLKVDKEIREQNQVILRSGNSYVCLHERPEAPKSSATVCSFGVENVKQEVSRLRDGGVKFEEYDIPEMGIKTENGIARQGDFEIGWFKDPWGNILAVDNVLTKTGHAMTPMMQ